jgi:hypothetical protein
MKKILKMCSVGAVLSLALLLVTGHSPMLNAAVTTSNCPVLSLNQLGSSPTVSNCNSITITPDANNNPLSKVNYIDPNFGAQQTPLVAFDINSNPSGLPVNSITINYNGTGTVPTGFYLFSGTTQISYQIATSNSGTMTFSNIPPSYTQTGNHIFFVKADFPSSTLNGSSEQVKIMSVATSNQLYTPLVIVSGNTQYFYRATPQLTFQSASAMGNEVAYGSTPSTIISTFNFTLTPHPGDEVYPQASDFAIVAQGSDGVQHVISSKGLIVSGNNVNQSSGILSANSTYNVTLSATANSSILPTSGTYTFYLTAASTTVKDYQGNKLAINQTFGLDNFHTSPIYYTAASGTTSSFPTATLLENGSHNIIVNPGDQINFTWSSTNADKFSSNYTVTGQNCGAGTTWVANSASGSDSPVVSSAQDGCFYTINYYATQSSTGKKASDVITVKVNPASTTLSANSANVLQAIKNIINSSGYEVGNSITALKSLFDELQSTVTSK